MQPEGGSGSGARAQKPVAAAVVVPLICGLRARVRPPAGHLGTGRGRHLPARLHLANPTVPSPGKSLSFYLCFFLLLFFTPFSFSFLFSRQWAPSSQSALHQDLPEGLLCPHSGTATHGPSMARPWGRGWQLWTRPPWAGSWRERTPGFETGACVLGPEPWPEQRRHPGWGLEGLQGRGWWAQAGALLLPPSGAPHLRERSFCLAKRRDFAAAARGHVCVAGLGGQQGSRRRFRSAGRGREFCNHHPDQGTARGNRERSLPMAYKLIFLAAV